VGKKAKNNSEPKTKKAPDRTKQKVKKARNALKSGGKRGLDAFLAVNPDIKGNAVVKALIQKAASMPQRPAKGSRGPKSRPKAQIEHQPA
jgi:hypothetical protein